MIPEFDPFCPDMLWSIWPIKNALSKSSWHAKRCVRSMQDGKHCIQNTSLYCNISMTHMLNLGRNYMSSPKHTQHSYKEGCILALKLVKSYFKFDKVYFPCSACMTHSPNHFYLMRWNWSRSYLITHINVDTYRDTCSIFVGESISYSYYYNVKTWLLTCRG